MSSANPALAQFIRSIPLFSLVDDADLNDVLRLFISLNGIRGPAEDLKELGVALRRPLKNLGLLSEFAASRIAERFGATPTLDVELHERLQAHARHFEKHVQELKDGAERVIREYRSEVVDRQQELERLSDMAIEMFATACVLSRTQQLLAERGEEGCTHELALCDLFVVDSGRRFRANRGSLLSTQDDLRRTVARGVRDAGGYAVPSTILPDETLVTQVEGR